MPKKVNSVVGIDVGSQQIKVAEIKLQGRDPVVTAIGMGPTPEGAVDHTGLYDVDAVSAAVKEIFTASGVSVPAMVITIAGQASVLVRTLEVPRMNDSDLKEHMQWEISRNIPFAESTVVSDYKAFPSKDAASQNMDVVMAISPQSAVDTLLSLAKKLAKQPYGIDVEPLSLARCLVTSGDGDQAGKTICVVEIGHKTTSINMYRDGELLMPRMVPIGGENFTRTIAENLGLPFDEAEGLKLQRLQIPEAASQSASAGPAFASSDAGMFTAYNPFADDPMLSPAVPPANPYGETTIPPTNPYADPTAYDPNAAYAPVDPYASDTAGMFDPTAPPPVDPMADAALVPAPGADFADPEAMRVYNAMASILEEFLSEIRRSIDYYRSKGGDVDRVMLTGGGAKMRGMADFLEKSLGVPVAMLNPMQGLTVNAKRLEPGLLEEHGTDFSIAVGNGLYICFD